MSPRLSSKKGSLNFSKLDQTSKADFSATSATSRPEYSMWPPNVPARDPEHPSMTLEKALAQTAAGRAHLARMEVARAEASHVTLGSSKHTPEQKTPENMPFSKFRSGGSSERPSLLSFGRTPSSTILDSGEQSPKTPTTPDGTPVRKSVNNIVFGKLRGGGGENWSPSICSYEPSIIPQPPMRLRAKKLWKPKPDLVTDGRINKPKVSTRWRAFKTKIWERFSGAKDLCLDDLDGQYNLIRTREHGHRRRDTITSGSFSVNRDSLEVERVSKTPTNTEVSMMPTASIILDSDKSLDSLEDAMTDVEANTSGFENSSSIDDEDSSSMTEHSDEMTDAFDTNDPSFWDGDAEMEDISSGFDDTKLQNEPPGFPREIGRLNLRTFFDPSLTTISEAPTDSPSKSPKKNLYAFNDGTVAGVAEAHGITRITSAPMLDRQPESRAERGDPTKPIRLASHDDAHHGEAFHYGSDSDDVQRSSHIPPTASSSSLFDLTGFGAALNTIPLMHTSNPPSHISPPQGPAPDHRPHPDHHEMPLTRSMNRMLVSSLPHDPFIQPNTGLSPPIPDDIVADSQLDLSEPRYHLHRVEHHLDDLETLVHAAVYGNINCQDALIRMYMRHLSHTYHPNGNAQGSPNSDKGPLADFAAGFSQFDDFFDFTAAGSAATVEDKVTAPSSEFFHLFRQGYLLLEMYLLAYHGIVDWGSANIIRDLFFGSKHTPTRCILNPLDIENSIHNNIQTGGLPKMIGNQILCLAWPYYLPRRETSLEDLDKAIFVPLERHGHREPIRLDSSNCVDRQYDVDVYGHFYAPRPPSPSPTQQPESVVPRTEPEADEIEAEARSRKKVKFGSSKDSYSPEISLTKADLQEVFRQLRVLGYDADVEPEPHEDDIQRNEVSYGGSRWPFWRRAAHTRRKC